MKILLVAATFSEISPLTEFFVFSSSSNTPLQHYFYKGIKIDILISGVGMLATAYHLAKTLSLSSEEYDIVLNLGVAGSFDKQIGIGEVVNVVTDSLPELGAEDGKQFLPLQQLDLLNENDSPFTGGKLKNIYAIKNKTLLALPKVEGITVNTIHGNNESIRQITKRLSPQIESMEGAAFLYACLNENQPCAQIRAVSNYIEQRNKKNWNIPLAVKNLNQKALEIIKTL